MGKLTKHSSFEELKLAENTSALDSAEREKLRLETQQAATILHMLRLQKQQRNASK